MLCSSHYSSSSISTQFSTACLQAWIPLLVIIQVASGVAVKANFHQAHGSQQKCCIWKCRPGLQCHSRHFRGVEINKKCTNSPALLFRPAIGYNCMPPAHITTSKLHLLAAYSSPVHDQIVILSLPTKVLLRRFCFPLFLFTPMLLLLPPSFFFICSHHQLQDLSPALVPSPSPQVCSGRDRPKAKWTQLRWHQPGPHNTAAVPQAQCFHLLFLRHTRLIQHLLTIVFSKAPHAVIVRSPCKQSVWGPSPLLCLLEIVGYGGHIYCTMFISTTCKIYFLHRFELDGSKLENNLY